MHITWRVLSDLNAIWALKAYNGDIMPNKKKKVF